MADCPIPCGPRGATTIRSTRRVRRGGYYVACFVIPAYKKGQDLSLIFQKPPFNYQYQVGLANLVDYAVAPVTVNGPVVNGLLQSLTVKARTFAQDGQNLSVIATGTSQLATTAGDVTVTVNGTQIGGTNILIGGPDGWRLQVEMQRQGGDLLCSLFMLLDLVLTGAVQTTLPATRATYFRLTPVNFEQDIIIQFRGSAPATGPITQDACWASIQ